MRSPHRWARLAALLTLMAGAARSAPEPQAAPSPKAGATARAPRAPGGPTRSLGDALGRTLDMLVRERAVAEDLDRRIAAAREKLARGKEVLADLEQKIQAQDALIKRLNDDLGRWKDQVLGTRDEVVRSEEIEKEVLQEIVLLLRALNRRRPPSKAAPADAPPAAAAPGADHEK